MTTEHYEDPTAMTFIQYVDLDTDAKCVLLDEVYEIHKERIDQMLGNTATWLLICGPKGTIVDVAASESEIPTDDEICEKAAKIGYAPFHFFEDAVVEDLAAV